MKLSSIGFMLWIATALVVPLAQASPVHLPEQTAVSRVQNLFEETCRSSQNKFDAVVSKKWERYTDPTGGLFNFLLKVLLDSRDVQAHKELFLGLVTYDKITLEEARAPLSDPKSETLPAYGGSTMSTIAAYKFLTEELKSAKETDWEVVRITVPNTVDSRLYFYFFLQKESNEWRIAFAYGVGKKT